MNIKNEISKYQSHQFFCAFIILLFFLFIYSTKEVSNGALLGLSLCYKVVIPSLFPFFVLGNLFIAWGGADFLSKILKKPLTFLFRTSNCAAPFILGLLCGYPLGAKSVSSLYHDGKCSKNEAEFMLSFCNNTGPAFIIGATGIALFHSMTAGIILYICHIFSAVATGIILSRISFQKSSAGFARHEKARELSPVSDFIGAVSDGLSSILGVCAFVVFFSSFLHLLSSLSVFSLLSKIISFLLPFFSVEQIQALLFGFFEMTNGVSQSAASGASLSLAFCGMILSWGGLSIHFQTMLFTQEYRLSLKLYFIGKFLSGFFCFWLVLLTLRFYPVTISVFSPSFLPEPYLSSYFYLCAVCVIIFALLFLLGSISKPYRKIRCNGKQKSI